MRFNEEWKEYEEKIFTERDLWKYEGDTARRINLLQNENWKKIAWWGYQTCNWSCLKKCLFMR